MTLMLPLLLLSLRLPLPLPLLLVWQVTNQHAIELSINNET